MALTESLARALFQQAPVGVAVIDSVSGEIHDTNTRFALITGHTREQLAELGWSGIVDPRDASQDLDDRRRLNAGEIRSFRTKTRYTRPDGAVIWFGVTAVPVETEPDEARLHLALVEDITERLHDEEALAETRAKVARYEGEARLLGIFEHGVIGFAKLSLDGRLIRVNDRFCEITGRLREQLRGAPFAHVALPEDASSMQAAFDELLDGGSPGTIEPRFLHEDGSLAWTSVAITLLRDARGRPLQFVALALDVTKHRFAELRAREGAEHLRLVIDSARLGVWHRNLVTDRITWSDACLAHFGLPAGTDLDHEGFLAIVHPDDRPRIVAALARSLTTRTDFAEDYRVIWPDGSERWIAAVGRPAASPDGIVERMEGVVQDITMRRADEAVIVAAHRDLEDQKRRVELLNVQLARRAEDAETATRAKDTFLRNVTHEFRTPLHQILGGIDLLRGTPLDERQAKWADITSIAARKLQHLIDQTLDVTKLESGEMHLDATEFEPWAVMQEVMQLVSLRARQKGIALTADTGTTLPDRVRGDPGRLAQALLNFLDNAVKFTERGSVVLAARTLLSDAAGVLLRFEVRDTGIGIAPDVLEQLFVPFTQGDGSTTRAYGGVGIGLSNARELARLMGGTAGVESDSAAGSTFWLTARFESVEVRLPTGAAPSADSGIDASSPPEAGGAVPDIGGRDSVRSRLAELDALLSRDDMRSVGALKDSMPVLAAWASPQDLVGLRDEVARFDLEAALATVRRIGTRLDHAD